MVSVELACVVVSSRSAYPKIDLDDCIAAYVKGGVSEKNIMAGFLRVGLTGGIATGKSAVVNRWKEHGAAVIDCDLLAHQALAPDSPTGQEVLRRFGRQILDAEGMINRTRLGEIVFGDETQRLALNRIVHPVVQRMWTDALMGWDAKGRLDPVVVVIPLLYEVGAEREFDVVVVTACSEQTQLARLVGKGLSEVAARARIRSQWPTPLKADRADYVIWNDGALTVLHQQADVIWKTMKENHYASNEKKQ